jgi:transposase-like protein
MRQASKRVPDSAKKTVRDIRRAARRHHSAEEKIRIVLEGLRGEDSIAELCRKEGINQNLYYRWSKEFLEAGKKRLAGRQWSGRPPLSRRPGPSSHQPVALGSASRITSLALPLIVRIAAVVDLSQPSY